MSETDRKFTSSQRAALSRIRSLVEYWRITAEELQAPRTRRRQLSPDQKEALQRVRALVRAWDILPAELAPGGDAPPVGAPARYVHPVTGERWDGSGPQPDWLRRALLTEGYYVQDLKPQQAAAAQVEPAAH